MAAVRCNRVIISISLPAEVLEDLDSRCSKTTLSRSAYLALLLRATRDTAPKIWGYEEDLINEE